ncbi:MAG TPA: hypothetical protein PKN02_10640 [Thermotogota bacterium]|nr:hypothetical protein [Thermotogota bacterium]
MTSSTGLVLALLDLYQVSEKQETKEYHIEATLNTKSIVIQELSISN